MKLSQQKPENEKMRENQIYIKFYKIFFIIFFQIILRFDFSKDKLNCSKYKAVY